MTSWRTPIFVLCALAVAGEASSQEPDVGGRCYEFDRPYFSWSYGGRESGVQKDSADTLLLDSARHAGPAFLRPEVAWQVRPTTLGEHNRPGAPWLERSYWIPMDGDSIRVVWREGHYGPVFRLEVIEDTLRGVVVQTTDAYIEGRPRPQPQRASAVRVPCPG